MIKKIIIKATHVLKTRELVLYGLVGSFCAGLDFIVYTLLLQFDIDYIISNVISVNIGICTSFILNRRYTFKIKNKTIKRFLTFYVVGFTGLLLSISMLYVLVSFFHVDKVFSKIITIAFVALMQFILNKFVTFKL